MTARMYRTAGAADRAMMDLFDYVVELTRRHEHAEHYTIRRRSTTYGRNHRTEVPPLIAQLVAASPSGDVEGRDNSGYESRPTARLDALDTLARIDTEARAWLADLDHTAHKDAVDRATGVPIRGSGTAANVRLLGALAPSLERRDRGKLTADARRWWTWSRIVSGWDSAAWRPDNTCPMCGERRTLRINLAAEAGFCVADACRETWDASNLGLLADHIRAESEAEAAPPAEMIPCHRREPRPVGEESRWGMCPACGDPRCVNADAIAEREAERRRRARLEARLAELERIGRQYPELRGKVS